MSVRVRMAPSPTGFLHVGNVRTALFNWLFARHEGGEFLLRIENTDTGREVAEAAEQIQGSLRWLGLEWDGEVTFQLDRLERCQAEAHRLVDEGVAYVDDDAVRFRMPDEGVTAWDDLVLGPIEVKNETIEDLVILRSDGRPTYNFASAVEDWLDGITHVIRGQDHVPNTPKQIQILTALGAEPRATGMSRSSTARTARVFRSGTGRSRPTSFAPEGYLPDALVNYLALLGWSYDDKTTIMSPDELVERFSLDRVSKSPAVFDYEKLDWMNGVYLRALSEQEYADALVGWLREQGYDWEEARVRRAVPLVQEKIGLLSEFPGYAGFLFGEVEPDTSLLDGSADLLEAAAEALAAAEPFTAETIEAALRHVADERELKPREAFQPIRVAVTGSKVSPGLFESIELLGRDESVARLSC